VYYAKNKETLSNIAFSSSCMYDTRAIKDVNDSSSKRTKINGKEHTRALSGIPYWDMGNRKSSCSAFLCVASSVELYCVRYYVVERYKKPVSKNCKIIPLIP
jgi:hypothetical protein